MWSEVVKSGQKLLVLGGGAQFWGASGMIEKIPQLDHEPELKNLLIAFTSEAAGLAAGKRNQPNVSRQSPNPR